MTEDVQLSQIIAGEIRRSIFAQEYKAGSELRQENLAERFNVSRMPVRMALQLLADEDLITLRKNRSAVVNRFTDRDIRDHFELRGLLEGQAAVFAAQRGQDFSRLNELVERCREAQTGDPAVWEKYNYQFHQEIWKLADCRRLQRMIQQTWNAVSYVKKEPPEERMSVSTAEHQQICQAIVRRDTELAKLMMYRHIVWHNLGNFEIHLAE